MVVQDYMLPLHRVWGSSLGGIPHAVRCIRFPFGKEINEKKKKEMLGKNMDKKGGHGHIRSDTVDCKIESITRGKKRLYQNDKSCSSQQDPL